MQSQEMKLTSGQYLSRHLTAWQDPDAIGSPTHKRSIVLELARTLDDLLERNIVFSPQLDQVAREIARLAGGFSRRES